MTPCPNCRRPNGIEPTWETIEAAPEPYDVCWIAARGRDLFCAALARDNARRADAELLAAARCFPPGLLARVAHVLTVGGKARGVGPTETGGGQDVHDHLDHARAHLSRYEAHVGGPLPVDPATGETDAVHAIARLVLAVGMAK